MMRVLGGDGDAVAGRESELLPQCASKPCRTPREVTIGRDHFRSRRGGGERRVTESGAFKPRRDIHGAALHDSVEPTKSDRVTLAPKQVHALVKRQADDVGVGTDDLYDERAGDALRRVTPGFAAPLARSEIAFDVFFRESLKANAGFHQALSERFFRRHQANRGVHTVVTPRQKAQALSSLVEQLGLGED